MTLKREILFLSFLSIFSVVLSQNDYGGIFDDEEDGLSGVRAKWDDPVCDEEHKCVPYYLCKEDGNINTDGKFLLNPRNDGIEKPIPGCTALSMCCKRESYIKPSKDLCKSFPMPKKCGFRNLKGIGGTVGSVKDDTNPEKKDIIFSHYAEFPWMMGIIERFGKIDTVLGGGSLIHPKVVLTSAHNTANSTISNLRVRGGEWDAGTRNEMCNHTEKGVDHIIRHEAFNLADANFQNDIALIILKEAFELTPFINTICLPPPNTNFDGQTCVSSGWGKTRFVPESQSQLVQKKVVLPIVSHAECERMLRRTLLGTDFQLHKNFLCAGGEEGIDTCTGDGGAALACEIPGTGHYYQAGIVAAGIQCAKRDIPGLYTDVAKNRDWINNKLDSLRLDGNEHYTY